MARRAAMPGVTGGVILGQLVFFFSSRRRHTRLQGDWSSDVCSSDLFTHLSFRGAPRREPAFKYLSFRIRFSGEESAFCPGAHPFAFFAKRRGVFSSHRRGGGPPPPRGGSFFLQLTKLSFYHLHLSGAP